MTRPNTPDRVVNGRRTMTVKRCCDGCGEPIGDATDAELEAAVMGHLPSVIEEHGCQKRMAEAKEDAIIAQLLSRPERLATCNACKKPMNGQDECDCS